MTKPQAGARFGPYNLIRLLGQGGFAEVWEAETADAGRRVALKVLTEVRAESSEALDRFQLEGRLAASISHPRCVYVFGTEQVEGYSAITMELMPGGTLADRLKSGPLPVADAVDAVLHVIAGLEAAQQVGIIHRDIKPSNCFLDEAGGVKIGDFGISKSLGGEGKLTATGSFLGTPYYASPEQVGGENVDYRSDIYSVGAMLYELLTGQVPYSGTNPGQVIASVLTKEPTSFAQHVAQVPRGLQRVVLKSLAKQKEKRFQSYEAFRAALFPFSSRGLSPAGLAKRFGAVFLDLAMFAPLGAVIGLRTLSAGTSGRVMGNVAVMLLEITYFALMEGLLGWSVGKRLFGLRVTTAAGETLTVGRAFRRVLVFEGVYQVPSIIAGGFISANPGLATTPLVQTVLPVFLLLCAATLMSTMRKRNGYAGLHEILSGTRVVALEEEQRSAVAPRGAAATYEPLGTAAARYGPYTSAGVLWRQGDEAIVVARDEDLRRDVWIHLYPRGTVPPPVEELLRRRGAMPWLQRSNQGGATWDAYGAPQGIAFARWVAEKGSLSWKEMRGVLHSLARELATRLANGGTAGRLSLNHVWVDAADNIALLAVPFDAPGSGPLSVAEEINAGTWLAFTRRVVTLGFGGDPADPAAQSKPPRVPMPDHARIVLAQLYAETKPFQSPVELVAALDRVATRPVEVTQLRRFGPVGVAALVPAIGMFAAIILPLLVARAPTWFSDFSSRLPAYTRALKRLEPDSGGKAPRDSAAARDTVRAIRIVLSAAYAESRKPELAPVADGILKQLPRGDRAAVDRSVALYPNPSAADVVAARLIGAQLTKPDYMTIIPGVLLVTFVGCGWVGMLAVVLAFVVRGGAMLRMFGVRVQRLDGMPSERWRAALRSLIAWAPLIVLAVLGKRASYSLAMALIAISLVGTAWSLLRPSRGPADLLARTTLMPK